MTDAEKFGEWVMRHFRSWDAYEASLPSGIWYQTVRLPDPDCAWQPTDETVWVCMSR